MRHGDAAIRLPAIPDPGALLWHLCGPRPLPVLIRGLEMEPTNIPRRNDWFLHHRGDGRTSATLACPFGPQVPFRIFTPSAKYGALGWSIR